MIIMKYILIFVSINLILSKLAVVTRRRCLGRTFGLTFHLYLSVSVFNSVHGYFKCTNDGFFPDKTDCWVYHICDGGTHSVRACEEDLYFNSKTGLCDWPMNVECKQTVTKSPAKGTAHKTSTKTTLAKTTKDKVVAAAAVTTMTALETTNNELALDRICAPEDYGYMSHPKDCRKYIYCQEGTAKIFTCQGGLLWKQDDGNCVWPTESDCN